MLRALLLLAALLVAGCATPGPDAPATASARFHAPVIVAPEGPGGEPVLAIHPSGALFVEAVAANGNRLWRSTDEGATWTDVTPPGEAARERSLDGFVAIGAGGHVYYANAHSRVGFFDSALALYRSDDLGATWATLTPPPWPTPMHRMWIVADGDASVHLAVEGLFPNLGLWYVRSDDRGATWGPPVPVDPGNGFGSDLAVAPGGQEIHAQRLAFRFEGSSPQWDEPADRYLMSSIDGGRTWQRRDLFPQEARISTSWQRLIAAEGGILYLVWSEMREGSASAVYSVSLDKGARWSAPFFLGNTSASQALPWAALRGSDGLALLWYGADATGHPNDLDAEWHAEVAFVHNASGPAPTFDVHRVSPAPLKRGALCTDGPFCGAFPGGEDRELLDYPWIAIGQDGLARIAYAAMEEDGTVLPVFQREQGAPTTGPTTR